MYKKINKEFDYPFNVKKDGIYTILIEASCKSGRILGLFGGEDLRVEIDGMKLREVPAKNKPQYNNIPPSWNGTQLKGFSKTVVVILRLAKGEHALRFIPKRGATIVKEPEISIFDASKPLLANIQAPEGNRRPWITAALVDMPLKTVDVAVKCEKREPDSDDVKLIIDGKIEKNEQKGWWGKNWYWQGSELQGNTKEARFYSDAPKGIHYIELWADRMPVLESLSVNIGDTAKEDDTEDIRIKEYTYRGVSGKENYNRYDTEILAAVDEWNREFMNDAYPPSEPLDPNLVKAMIFVESRIGYERGGEVDVMQVGNPGDDALRTLNHELEESWFQNGKRVNLDSKGAANADAPAESIKWGVRWLYHKAQKREGDGSWEWMAWQGAMERYGPQKVEHNKAIWSIYENGVDTRNNKSIRLWSVLLFALVAFGIPWLVSWNQGQVYFNYFDRGEQYYWLGRTQLSIGVFDGIRTKRAVIGPIDDRPKSHAIGLLKDSILVDYYDFDNDGKDDVLVSARHFTDNEVMHFFRIGKRALEPIRFIGHSNPFTGDNSLYADNIRFGRRDALGRYMFIEENTVRYSNASDQVWRTYYRFNENNDIVIDRKEQEDIVATSAL